MKTTRETLTGGIFYCRDRVNRAAGRRTAVSVFCFAIYKAHLDKKLSRRQPGLCRQDNFIVT